MMTDEKRLPGGKFRCTLQPSNELALPSEANWDLVIHHETNDTNESHAKSTGDLKITRQEQHGINIGKLRKFLSEYFNENQLINFCFDNKNFSNLYREFEKNRTDCETMARRILECARQKGILQDVDEWAKGENSKMYNKYFKGSRFGE